MEIDQDTFDYTLHEVYETNHYVRMQYKTEEKFRDFIIREVKRRMKDTTIVSWSTYGVLVTRYNGMLTASVDLMVR